MKYPVYEAQVARKLKSKLHLEEGSGKMADPSVSEDADRGKMDVNNLTTGNILQLQRTLGNQAVARMVQQQNTGPTIQRVLLQQADWKQTTTGISRKKSATMLRLDTLINNYEFSPNLENQERLLQDIQTTAEDWLSKHNVKSSFNSGMARRIRGLKHEAINELASIQSLNQRYNLIVGDDLPKDQVTKTQAADLLQRFTAVNNYGYTVGQWAFQLLERVDARKLTSPQAKMDALYNEYLASLTGKFTYNSAGSPTVLETGTSGNCQNLSLALMVLGLGLGLNITTEVVSNDDFASEANSKFISPHGGNVKFEGQGGYNSKRYIFSMHVAAKFNGVYYDPTTRSKYNSSAEAVSWSLKNSGNNKREFLNVKDAAKFPDGTPITPNNAEIVLDPSTTSVEFGYYWIIRRKDQNSSN